MFRPAEVIIDAFVQRMDANFQRAFVGAAPEWRQCLNQVARMALMRMTLTNALYSNLELVLLVTQVAEEVLQGRAIARGDVTPSDWVHFAAAALCHQVGFVRGSVPGDDGRVCVINAEGETRRLSPGETDGALWPHWVDRSKLFVQDYFRGHPLIDGNRVAECIEYVRFPLLLDRNLDNDGWPGLLRGAQMIGVVADPRFEVRIKFLNQQWTETGVGAQLGYPTLEQVLDAFPKIFWENLFPRIGPAIAYLKFTSDGLTWLASMNAHMLVEEHRNSDRRA